MKVVSPREGYHLWAESFDTSGSAILALESRHLASWIAALRGRVIDVGCGTGRWMSFVKAVGVDASRDMLRAASGKPGLAGRLAQADGRRLPFRDATADATICTLTIGHMQPVYAALAELARITRPGGIVIVTDFHPDALRLGWKRTFSREGETCDIETAPYELSEASHRDLQLQEFCEPSFDEPERSLFDAAGKSALFAEVRGVPAIWMARFLRRSE